MWIPRQVCRTDRIITHSSDSMSSIVRAEMSFVFARRWRRLSGAPELAPPRRSLLAAAMAPMALSPTDAGPEVRDTVLRIAGGADLPWRTLHQLLPWLDPGPAPPTSWAPEVA